MKLAAHSMRDFPASASARSFTSPRIFSRVCKVVSWFRIFSWKATVLVETSSNGATEPYSPRGVSGSCLVDRPVDGIDAYLDRLASADPTPGGGSAATLVGAEGGALGAWVGRRL